MKDRITREIRIFSETDEEKKKKYKNLDKTNEINNRLIKDRIIRDIKTLFEEEDHDNHFTPKKASNFLNNEYVDYQGSGSRNTNLLLNESVNNIKPYQRDLTIDFQISDTWKIQLTDGIDFFFTRGAEEEHVMHPSSDHTKLTLILQM